MAEKPKTLSYEVGGRIARITLDRPERGNGITLEMPRELAACVERANLDPEVHVIALSGKDKGKSGIVMEVRPKEQRVLVEGLNIMKRHTKPRPPNEPGGVIERPAPIHLSNVALIDPKDGRATRIRIEELDGRPVRVSSRSGERLD